MARHRELIVRGAGDDLRLEARDGRVVERGAERARRDHIALDLEDLVERDDARAELARGTLRLERIDIGDGYLRALRVELLAEVVADMADPLYRDVHALERVTSELQLHARLDAAAHAKRGEGRGIAGAAVRDVDAGDAPCHRADHLHVLEAGAAVLGGDVVATEVVDELAERAEERDAVEVLLGADEHALAAAVREAGERRLVGHAAGEAERVDERLLVRVVREEATTTERGSEPRVVDGDDGLQAGRLVVLEVNLAVVVSLEVSEQIHVGSLVARRSRRQRARS